MQGFKFLLNTADYEVGGTRFKFRRNIKPKSKILTLINPVLADIHLGGFCQSSSESNKDKREKDTLNQWC